MADISSHTHAASSRKVDRVWVAIALILLIVGIVTPDDFTGVLGDAASSLGHTAIFIAFAVFAVAYLKASGAETLLAKAFQGREVRMIFMAALMGGLSPFCSCEVIPFIAAMLALGAPLSAVMAFWLSSPLMDPPMFIITAGALGLNFAIAKTVAAVGLGLLGGFGVKLLARTSVFDDPLRPKTAGGCSSCSSETPFEGEPVWKFWGERERTDVFRQTATENALFLLKWLALAYVLEALMVRHIPAELIATSLGGDGFGTVLLASLIGGPAYLNGYAAVPLLEGLLSQGMSQGAAMSFVIAGGISCIPAAIAVWAMVKPRVFAGYLGFAFLGALLAGMVWGMIA